MFALTEACKFSIMALDVQVFYFTSAETTSQLSELFVIWAKETLK
jgi:hypothetical protein